MSKLNSKLRWCDDHIVDFEWGDAPNMKDGGRRRLNGEGLPKKPWLFLILESPHKNEFKGADESLHGPARGITGKYISKYLHQILESKSLELKSEDMLNKIKQCRGLVIMNAIQHQCSEGKGLQDKEGQARRDNNFIEIWDKAKGKEDFEERITRHYRQGDVVVLACTHGTTPGAPLRNRVQKSLEEKKLEIDAIVSHPYSWFGVAKR